ncbi:recombinase family protein [Amycolatopsis sp. NPDC059027]|uniref:recombinase family protein n=1 Tax=Amycolatopsis sp. NPDC059027 TaxID=3346709 RepID=UPI003670DB62
MAEFEQVNAGQDSSAPVEGAGPGLVIDSYARLSWKPGTRDLEKIEDQLASNKEQVRRAGGTVGKELSDGASAWKKGRKRPGWDELLERLESGVSQGVVVWNTDRLMRAPMDLEKLIELGDQGYRVLSATGEYDLSNPDHRYTLRNKTAQAMKESDDKSRRLKERYKGYRARGRAHSTARRFGFPGRDLTWVPPTDDEYIINEDGEEILVESLRPKVSRELVQREREALATEADNILAGRPLSEVAREWNAAGLYTPYGREWIPITVRETFKRPTLAGRIEHDGVLEGRMRGEPILEEATFLELRALFASRRRGAAPGRKYLGSGIIRCGVCYRPLHGRTHGKRKDGTPRYNYFCNKGARGCGTIFADMDAVDTQLRAFVLRRLSDKSRAAAINAARSRVAGRHAEIAADLERLRKLQAGISARLGLEEMSEEAFDAANRPLVKRIKALTKEQKALPGGSPETPLVPLSVAELKAEWDRAELISDRRRMLTSALEGRWLVINPRGKGTGHRGFDPARVVDIPPNPDPEDDDVDAGEAAPASDNDR